MDSGFIIDFSDSSFDFLYNVYFSGSMPLNILLLRHSYFI